MELKLQDKTKLAKILWEKYGKDIDFNFMYHPKYQTEKSYISVLNYDYIQNMDFVVKCSESESELALKLINEFKNIIDMNFPHLVFEFLKPYYVDHYNKYVFSCFLYYKDKESLDILINEFKDEKENIKNENNLLYHINQVIEALKPLQNSLKFLDEECGYDLTCLPDQDTLDETLQSIKHSEARMDLLTKMIKKIDHPVGDLINLLE